MAVTMTVNAIAEDWLTGSLRINDNINARSSASFTLDTDNTITVGMEVIILDDATRVFAGEIDRFTRTSPKGTTLKRYNISCLDFNKIADRRRVAATYEDKTVSYIVNDIITNVLADENVTAGTIATGPTMEKVVFNRISAADALNYIKDATGLNWNINYDKELNIFYREDNTDTGFTDTLNNFLDMQVEETREEYRNSQYVRGGQETTTTITKESANPKPDGVSKVFYFRYPVAEKPTIYVDDVAIAAGDVGIGGLEVGKKYYWNKGSNEISQDDGETVLSDAQTLTMTYKGLRKVVVQANNLDGQTERQLVEGGTGIYEALEQVASLESRKSALDYAKSLLEKYEDIPKRVFIETTEYKQAGKLIPIEVAKLDLDDDYLIESVTISERGNTFFYNINCLSGESLGSWVEFFRKMRNEGRQFVIKENEVLVLLTNISETWKWTEKLTARICEFDTPRDDEVYFIQGAAFPARSNGLYPSETLYPGVCNTVTIKE